MMMGIMFATICMKGRLRHIGLTLFTIVVLIVSAVWGQRRKREEMTDKFNASVLVLILYSDNNPRWVYQYEKYKKFIELNKHDNIHFKFMQCGKEVMDDEHHLYLNCTDSAIPGELLKTILAMKKHRDQYDYVLRTNISTYISVNKLIKMIQQIDTKKDVPLYTGGIRFDWGISGTSILMNRKAANILVDELFPHYESVAQNKNADDVVMGSVLKKYMQYDDAYTIYYWDFEKTPDENIKAFRGRKTPFIRLKPSSDDNPSKMDPIYDKLVKEYYTIL